VVCSLVDWLDVSLLPLLLVLALVASRLVVALAVAVAGGKVAGKMIIAGIALVVPSTNCKDVVSGMSP
jgi:hypothetical protein